MFKISNSNPSNAQGQAPADLPIHTMKKDLEEIEHPSEFKKNEPESQERYLLNDTQKSSPFLSSTPQPKQAPASTSIKFKDEASEQRISEDRIAKQKAEEKRLTEQKAEMARKMAGERRLAEQKILEEKRIKEEQLVKQRAEEEIRQKAEERRLAEQKIAEERLAKQKAVMAQKMAEENAAMERKMAEQKAEAEKMAMKQAEEQRKAAQRADEEKRLAEQKTSEQRLLKEKMIAEQKAEKEKKIAEKNAKNLATAEDRTTSKNVTYLIVSAILVLLIAGGGYYFWITRQQKESSVIVIQEPEPEPEPQPKPEPEPSKTFSTDKPNYLIVEQVGPTAGEIKIALKKYSDDVAKSGITVPVEFVVVDAQNNPIIFSTFANNFGLTLSPAIMSNLEETFSLFIYNDQGTMRLGLNVDSKNDTALKSAMLKEKRGILSQTLPLFMDASFATPVADYAKWMYHDAELYYVNLVPSAILASNYGVFNKKLLIGTSKNTIYSMVDYIKNSSVNITE